MQKDFPPRFQNLVQYSPSKAPFETIVVGKGPFVKLDWESKYLH
jgi:hypothetical protein